jgi:hypothetical protein
MNELEQIVKAMELFEDKFLPGDIETQEEMNNVFIIDTDIDEVKRFLKKALNQLENLEIKIKKESEYE